MHTHNTGSTVAAVSPINVKQPKALDESKFVFNYFYTNVTITSIVSIIHLVGIWAYFIYEHNIVRMNYMMLDMMACSLFLYLDSSSGSIDEAVL